MKINNTPLFIFFFLLALLALVFGPFAVVWALNTLFTLSIPYNPWTWLSVIILFNFFHSDISFKNK